MQLKSITKYLLGTTKQKYHFTFLLIPLMTTKIKKSAEVRKIEQVINTEKQVLFEQAGTLK